MKILLLMMVLSVLSVLATVDANRYTKSHKPRTVSTNFGDQELVEVSRRHGKSKNGRSAARRTTMDHRTQQNHISKSKSKDERRWLSFTEAKKEIENITDWYRIKINKTILKKSNNKDEKNANEKDCHFISMWECGCESLKAFQFVFKNPSITNDQRHHAGCGIRQKFFDCLGNFSKVECKHPKLKLMKILNLQGNYTKFKNDTVDMLRTNRDCLIVPVNAKPVNAADKKRERNSIASKFKVWTPVCKKLKPRKHHKKHHKKLRNG